MAAVSKAFATAPGPRGVVIGIVPGDLDPSTGAYHPQRGYPNEWVELAIFTHLPWSGVLGEDTRSRNHLNVLSSDVIVVLPGGPGTAAEVALGQRYGKPLLRLDHLSPDLPAKDVTHAVDAVLSDIKRLLDL
jgi:predicted Rossmann-fold nucleotide-binding protein